MSLENVRKGPWYEEEDEQLKLFVTVLGARRWDSIARISGLRRSGKSCRLRWLNYLRPYLKHDPITPQEEQLILELHQKWGNKWAKIARRLPGRTDNEIKNYWRTHLRKKLQLQQNSLSLLQYSSTSPSPSSSNSVGSSLVSKSSSEHTSNSRNQIVTNLQDGDTITNTEIICNTNNSKSIIDEYNCDINDKKGLLSDNMITHSPYENRVSDWINMVSMEQINDSSLGCCAHNGSSLEFCLDYYPMNWSCLGGDSVWDFTDTKWDMDLFNVNNGCIK